MYPLNKFLSAQYSIIDFKEREKRMEDLRNNNIKKNSLEKMGGLHLFCWFSWFYYWLQMIVPIYLFCHV